MLLQRCVSEVGVIFELSFLQYHRERDTLQANMKCRRCHQDQ